MADQTTTSANGERTKTLRLVLRVALVSAVIGAWWARSRNPPADHPQAHSFHEVMQNVANAGYSRGLLISVFFLVAFSIYWEVAAARKAENKSAESPFSRGIHLALLSVGQVLLIFPIPGLRMRFLPDTTLVMVVGLGMEAAGIFFAVWARHTLGRNWNASVAAKVDHELIRTGPYQWVRHPIYTGVLALYAGVMIVVGEVHSALGLLLICGAYWRKIRQEETLLAGLFGPAYEEYRKTSKAVIPGVL